MSMRQCIGSRTCAVSIAATVLLALAAPPAPAQEVLPAAAGDAPALDMQASVVVQPQDEGSTEPSTDTSDLPVATDTGKLAKSQVESIEQGVGSAQLQTKASK